MLTVYLHELRDQLRSLRFQVSLVVLLLFFVGNGVIYTLKMGREVEETARIQADLERELGAVATVGRAVSGWYAAVGRAAGTEFIAEGGSSWFRDSKWLSPQSGFGMSGGNRLRTTNHWMRRFEVVDWTVIARVVVSFLCVVLAYDAISADHERGTLRLAMANPLSRGRLLAGRFLAQWTTLMVSLALGAAVSLSILVLNGVLTLDAATGRGIGLYFAATALYAACFLLLATGTSALARSSATALVLLVLAWAVLTVVIPQSAYLVGSRAAQVEERFWERGWDLYNQAEQALQREGVTLRDPEAGRADGWAAEQEYARRMADVEQEQVRILRRNEGAELEQYRVARTVNLLSPGYAYQYTVEAFLGTGLVRRQSLLEQADRYRETLRQFLRGRDADDPDSPHVLYLDRYMSQQPLDPEHLPRFRQEPVPFAAGLASGMVPMVVLCAETAAAFLFAFWAFLRMELAGGA